MKHTRHVLRVWVATGVLLLAAPATNGNAQTHDGLISGRLDRLEQSIRDLQDRVAELSNLLRAALPPSPVIELKCVRLSQRGAVRGSVTAKLILVEFTDFECPFCGRHASTVYRELQRRYVDTGELQYVFRHLPLEQIHPSARRAAEAAECAGDQGKFWELHDRFFEHQKSLGPEDLVTHARV